MNNRQNKKSDPQLRPRLAILMACFNRRAKTLLCLESIASQQESAFCPKVFLMDNGSDGTSDEVARRYPEVVVIRGESTLFWAGSMRRIWQYILDSEDDFNYFLLLNDDTILNPSAFVRLWSDSKKLNRPDFILIGSTKDRMTGKISYGGYRHRNKYGSDARRVLPATDTPKKCDMGNGNIMLVSRQVVDRIGILSDLFTHGIADFDYSLRAKKAGIPSFIASGYLGHCTYDHGNKWWNAKEYPLRKRIQKLYDVKGLAYKEYLVYLRLHYPFYLPQAWFQLWLKTLFPFLWDKLKKEKAPMARPEVDTERSGL